MIFTFLTNVTLTLDPLFQKQQRDSLLMQVNYPNLFEVSVTNGLYGWKPSVTAEERTDGLTDKAKSICLSSYGEDIIMTI